MNFRIANFNVENLILPDIRYYDRMILTREDYEAKANWSASIINRVKPDIIGVQELWTAEALEDVLRRSFHFASGAHICAPGATVAENVKGRLAQRPRLAIVSRFPIAEGALVPLFPTSLKLRIPMRLGDGSIREVPLDIDQFQRPVLKAWVDVEGMSIMVVVAHLKSKSPIIRNGEDGEDPFMFAIGQARATILRTAEAAALRHLILQDMARTRTPVIVLADLNDTPDAASTQIVCGMSPHEGKDFSEKKALWDTVLYPTFRIASRRSSSIHTHIYNGDRDILDHILVSEEFYSRNRHRIGTVTRHGVINDHLRDNEALPKPPGASDHGIPWAEITFTG